MLEWDFRGASRDLHIQTPLKYNGTWVSNSPPKEPPSKSHVPCASLLSEKQHFHKCWGLGDGPGQSTLLHPSPQASPSQDTFQAGRPSRTQTLSLCSCPWGLQNNSQATGSSGLGMIPCMPEQEPTQAERNSFQGGACASASGNAKSWNAPTTTSCTERVHGPLLLIPPYSLFFQSGSSSRSCSRRPSQVLMAPDNFVASPLTPHGGTPHSLETNVPSTIL